jgi:hypothetical protein
MSDTNVHRVVGNLLVGTGHLFVDTVSNQIGVNTSTPSAALDVASGDLKVGSDITIGNSGTITAANFSGNGSGLSDINSDSGSWVKDDANGLVYVSNSAHKVGIGLTSPDEKLDIDGGNIRLRSTGTAKIFNHSAGSDYGNLQISSGYQNDAAAPKIDLIGWTGAGTVDGDNLIKFSTNNSVRMCINQSGNVGCGTSSPQQNLHVHESGSGQVVIAVTNDTTGSGDNDGIHFGIDSSEQGFVWHKQNTALLFATNNAERMRLTNDGKLGIGTTTPHGALDVRGAVTITPSSTVDSYATKNGYMAAGSLNIGSIGANFGGGTAGWNSNTAGLMLECADNTEIAVHDSGTRVASLMYYEGGSNTITMGRSMGWGRTKINHAFTEKFNFHWNPNQWGYATNAYATELNLWDFTLNVPYDGWIFIKCHAHWARLNSANNAHAGGNDSFYAWLSVASRSPDLSANYDSHSGASNSSYDKFHSYQSPDASGAGSWRDFNHSGFYKVSAGNNTVSLRVVNYFTGGHHLNINGGAVSGFYMPKNYV